MQTTLVELSRSLQCRHVPPNSQDQKRSVHKKTQKQFYLFSKKAFEQIKKRSEFSISFFSQ